MNKLPFLLSCALAATGALAQTVAIFPDEYVDVPEGPLNSANLPLARGTSRVQCLYNAIDLAIPSGHSITKLGFREDTSIATIDNGQSLQLEIRMGYSTLDHVSMTTNFDNNYAAPPVTVFGPALLVLPALRDPNNPLPNGQFFITLTTPFQYVPNGQNLVVEYRVFGTSGGGAQFNWRLDRADFYSPVSYGPAGCPHSGGGTPSLTLQPTAPSNSFSCSLSSGPAFSPTFLALNIGSFLAPAYPLTGIFAGISPACTGQMDPNGLLLFGPNTTSGSGTTSFSFFIPNSDTFADLPMSAQALFLDFFSPGGLVVSRGGQLLTGARSRSSIVAANGAPTALTTGSKSSYYCPVAFFEHQ